MAFDKTDPADQKILADAIKAAEDELKLEHEADVTGLKNKNKELLAKISKGEANPAEVAALETKVEELTTTNKTLAKDLKTANTSNADLKTAHEAETKFTTKLLVDNGLNDALIAAKIATQYMPAAKALLRDQVSIKVDGENRTAMVGDKPLGEFVPTWAQGEHGKIYVAAAVNSGGGGGGSGKVAGAAGTMTRAVFDSTSPMEQGAFFKNGGVLVD